MNLSDYFNPVNDKFLNKKENYNPSQAGYHIFRQDFNLKKTKKADIGIIGLSDNIRKNSKKANAPDQIRKCLYNLCSPHSGKYKITDFGNLRDGITEDDIFFALRDVTSEMIVNGITPVIIGGSNNILYYIYDSFALLKQRVNYSFISPQVQFSLNDTKGDNSYLLNKMLKNKKNYLVDYTVIGYQQYLNSEVDIEMMMKMGFYPVRLGQARNDLVDVEPEIRDSDIFAVDINSIRFSDAPGQLNPLPNGFYGDEICRISKFAGLSEKCKVFALTGVLPEYDVRNITSSLSAQIIWYFINGFYNRIPEHPENINKNKFFKFSVSIDDSVKEINFYKNKITEKWWMDVPVGIAGKSHLISCNYNDYNTAKKGTIPVRWWNSFKKLN